MYNKKSCILLFLFVMVVKLNAQFSGYNVSEFQYGNIPGYEPKDRNTLYNQFNLLYREKNLKIKLRSELFYSNDSVNIDKISLSQLSVSYKIDDFKFHAGNMYETLGRGLLLRSYEVTGSIYESRSFRAKHAFYRDVLGVSTEYNHKIFSIKMLHGKVLNNLLPPGYEERRTDLISAFESTLTLFDQTLGGRIMRWDASGKESFYSSASMEGVLPFRFLYYSEFMFDQDDGRGLYASISNSFWNIGFSLEYKNFQNIFIGSGISDPPTLVKEQSYKLLNRSTHETNLFHEEGYQFELYYTFPDLSVITFNTSRAVNDISSRNIFYEYFVEYSLPVGSQSSIKTFFDWSASSLFSENQRLAGGTYFSVYLADGFSGILDFQYQQIKRENAVISSSINNLFSSVSISKSNKLSLSLLYEFTDDPWYVDRPDTEKNEKVRHFPGINLGYKPSEKINISLFAGSRRGGPACTAGICYEVLDFEGVEMRITSKF